MGFSYKPLFHILVERNMEKTDLCKKESLGLALTTIARFSKGEPVDGKVILKLCEYFHCQPGDIFEYVEPGKSSEGGSGWRITEQKKKAPKNPPESIIPATPILVPSGCQNTPLASATVEEEGDELLVDGFNALQSESDEQSTQEGEEILIADARNELMTMDTYVLLCKKNNIQKKIKIRAESLEDAIIQADKHGWWFVEFRYCF